MRAADYIVDIGPGAGVHGGEVVAQGTPEEIMRLRRAPSPGSICPARRKSPCPHSGATGNGHALIDPRRGARTICKHVDVEHPAGTS